MVRWWCKTFVLTACIFIGNFVLPSDLNSWSEGINFSLDPLVENSFFEDDTTFRLHNPEFGRRPLMVNLMSRTHSITQLPYPLIFIFYQFCAYLGICYLLRKTSEYFDRTISWAAAVLPFALLFPNIFLFTAHAHTYNDLFQYIALLALINCLLRSKLILSGFFFFIAIVIRETSILFLPFFAAFLFFEKEIGVFRAILYPVLLVLSAIATVVFLTDSQLIQDSLVINATHRWSNWQVNFSDVKATSETLWLTILICAPSAWICYSFQNRLVKNKLAFQMILWWIVTLLFNTILVYVSAYAREARLLFLPNLIVLPVLATYWQELITRIRLADLMTVRTFGVILFAAAFAQITYIPSVGGTGYVYRLYLLLWTLFATVLVVGKKFADARSLK